MYDRLIVCTCVCVCGVVVCVCVYVLVCVNTSAVLYIRNYVSSISWKRFVHINNLLVIILNWTCSRCVLFALYDWNATKTNSSAHFCVGGE